MTNAEKYREEIENYKGDVFCNDFIEPLVLKEKGLSCSEVNCGRCYMLQIMWLMDKYREPEIDWSKVAVDTPVLVRNYKEEIWYKRHFAKYEDDKVYVWSDRTTSWTGSHMTPWKFVKLAEESDE